jgi:hypothetical protein
MHDRDAMRQFTGDFGPPHLIDLVDQRIGNEEARISLLVGELAS